jgi:hypothetical protein
MKKTVTKIENDIFNLFSNTEIKVSDKKKVSTIESALFSHITSLEKNTSKESQEIRQRLSIQKQVLTNIRNSIDQVNNPPTLEKSIL